MQGELTLFQNLVELKKGEIMIFFNKNAAFLPRE